MSKSIGKRRKKRHEELKLLAVTAPDQFMMRWNEKVASWAGEARKYVQHFDLEQANGMIEYALQELRSCGPAAWQLAEGNTRQVLGQARNEAVKALAGSPGLKNAWDRKILNVSQQAIKYTNSLNQPRAFQLVTMVLTELKACGEDIWDQLANQLPEDAPQECFRHGSDSWEQIAAYTKLQLEAACATSIAQVVNPSMYRFYDYTRVCDQLEQRRTCSQCAPA